MSQINYVETADFYVERDVMKAPLHEMHYHNGVEVYYLIKGERDYFIGDDFYKLTEGDAVIIPGGVLHRTAGRGASRYLVYFDPDILIGGFHYSKIEPGTELDESAVLLSRHKTVYYTCHCTGTEQYTYMQRFLPQLHYLSCGDTLIYPSDT